MPKAIQDLLPDKNGASIDVFRNKNEKPGRASFKDNSVSVGVGGSGGTSVDIGHKGAPYVRVHPTHGTGPPSFEYQYAASEDQLRDNPNVALFFLEKDLHPGAKMNLHFIKLMSEAKFLPRQVAVSIPFSSNKFSEILNRFPVKPRSEEAQVMKETIEECEEPAVQGEDKYCATSLEAMIDFSTLELGKDVQVMSTEVDKEKSQQEEFTISKGVKKMATGDNTVVCHGQSYLYPVFYCHATHNTRGYVVPLVGADGTKAKAVAICHTNTSAWNPKHLAFQVLKVKPGTVPVCHFLPEDHIIWASN